MAMFAVNLICLEHYGSKDGYLEKAAFQQTVRAFSKVCVR